MFDIAALFSAKTAVPGAEITPAQGMETADIQAFGNILASQVEGQAGMQPSDTTIPLFSAAAMPIAGKLPEGGKILPDGLPDLPKTLPETLPREIEISVPTQQLAIEPFKRASDAAGTSGKVPAQALEDPKAEALTRILAEGQALKAALGDAKPVAAPITGKRQEEAKAAENLATDKVVAAAEGSGNMVAAIDQLPLRPVEAVLIQTPPALPTAQLAPQVLQTGNEGGNHEPVATARTPARALPQTLPQAPHQAAPMAAATSTVAIATASRTLFHATAAVAPVPATPAPPATLPLIEPASPSDEAAATPITVLPAPAAATAAASANANRFRVAPTAPKPQPQGADAAAAATPPLIVKPAADQQPVEAPPIVARAAAPAVERDRPAAPAVQQPVPAIADTSQALPQNAAAPAPVQSSAVPQPGHDFVKLVDRLIEARDAVTPQSVHAAIKHAEFGQVSLHFQQDAGGLTVSMASADPDFTPAVQAAMPADRGGTASDQSQGQGQSQNQSQYQSANGNNASLLQQDQRGTGSNEQARNAQGRDGRPAANPSQTAQGEAKGDRRSGIFA